MIKIYADKIYEKYCMRKIDKLYKHEKPKIKCVPWGVIANQVNVGFGVFDRDYKFVKSSIQSHHGQKGQIIPKFSSKDIKHVDYDVVFLCHTGRNHFGHFLLEQINRAWPLVNENFKNIKIVVIDEKNQGELPGFVYELLGLLGVKKQNVILLNKSTQFKNVYVPEPGFDMYSYYTESFAQMFDKMSSKIHTNKIYEKIYVSRMAMPDNRRTFNEEKIQKIFEKNGYKVIYPETLPLKKQIALIKNCKDLAGCAGTALHLALFMKPGGRVIQIKRNSKLADNADVQHLINISKGLDSVFISGSVETRKTDHWSTVPQIVSVTKYMKQFFDDNGFLYDDADLVLDEKERIAYESALKEIPYENPVVRWLKRKFIHYSSCLIIGRKARKEYRRFMRSRWG